MSSASDETSDVLATGWWGEVRYSKGKCAARSWLEIQPAATRAKFDVLFRKMAETGVIKNVEQFRKLKGSNGIYEFKRGGDRLLCFFHGQTVYLTSHLSKSGRKNISADIKKAEEIKKEYNA